VAAINSRDLDAALELWAYDALFLPVVGDPVAGRDAIRHVLGALTSSGTMIEIETASTYVAGDTAVRFGRLKLVSQQADDATEFSSSYVTIYRRGDHGWRIVVDAPAGFPEALPL